jgi:UDP-N-acetylmuramoyl-tripeptide--D-alanyl-D-alanine ligase
MNPINLAEICRVVDAPAPALPASISAVFTDTRQKSASALFVALRGEKFDGHDFLKAASEGGAVAALVDRDGLQCPASLQLVRVKDTRRAMGALARHIRRQLRGKVIAVAGSNGKTGTKYLIDSVLRPNLHGSISPKSFNNDIGVPLAIFPAEVNQDYLVLELGTNHPGEIANLTDIALPDIAVITNCSAEHLEGLGDLAGVRRENASLLRGLQPGGTLIINGDDAALLDEVAAFRGDCITFGFSAGNEIRASKIRADWSGIHFTIEPAGVEAFVPLLGNHIAANALAAVAVGRVMGLSDERIVENLASATGPDMRLQRLETAGIRILNDAYNANPASMMAAIHTLASLPATGRKIAVLGDMRELGSASLQCHRDIGRFVAEKCGPDMLVCVGSESAAIASEAVKFGLSANRVLQYPDAAAAQVIVPRLAPGDLVLIKASRAIGLEVFAKAVMKQWPQPLAAAS